MPGNLYLRMGFLFSKPTNKGPAKGIKTRQQNQGPASKATLSECKMVILGDQGVGKSSITYRYVENKFRESVGPTIGAQFQQLKTTLKNGNTLRINLWDTAGEEKFRSMLPMYYKDARGALITYDIGSLKSFESIDYWVNALDDNVKKDNCVMVLVGNKLDLDEDQKQVSRDIAQKYADNNNMLFFEVSAKTGEGVGELFKRVAEELARRFNY